MRKIAGILLSLCAALTLASCGGGTEVDTSAWRYRSFEEIGVALLLPHDLVREDAEDVLFRGGSDELRLEVSACDELFADAAALADRVGKRAGRETETAAAGGAGLVRLLPDEKSRTAEYYAISPGGDTYHILLAANEDPKDRHSAAVLSTAEASLCGCSDVPADAPVSRIHGRAERPMPDRLVLTNRRRALPEGWEAALDLVRTVNSRGEAITAERGVCKAFFALQKALAAEGVRIGAAAAYRADDTEHRTGLAFDLYLEDGETAELWERVYARLADFGFILRYPADGAYYTGRPFEPGHVRYVGADAAREIAARGLTLEEYLGEDPASVDFLVLVNAKNALPEGWEDTLELAHMTNRHGEDVSVERTAFDAYCRLRDALAEDGVHLDINSAYRSVAEQQALVKSYTQKYGADYVRAYVAVPGYSEHHTGLAIDLYLESPDVWAKIHARLAEHGFILRYPEGKDAITGYAYEPWHVRYVGVETAEEITERGLTLEEYLNAA